MTGQELQEIGLQIILSFCFLISFVHPHVLILPGYVLTQLTSHAAVSSLHSPPGAE